MSERVIDRTESQVPALATVPTPGPMTHAGGSEPSIGLILQQAVAQGMAPEGLEKLMALYERMSDRVAAHQYAAAMAAFKAECPAIPRRTENSQFKVTRDGVQVPRRYASLEDIAQTIQIGRAHV